MSSSYRAFSKVAKSGLLLLIATIAARAFGFLRQFVIIKMLSPEQYGIIAIGIAIFGISTTLSRLGLPQGTQRFIAYYLYAGDEQRVKGTIKASTLMVSISSLVIMSIIVIFSGSISALFSIPELKYVLIVFGLAVPFATVINIIASIFLGFHLSWVKASLEDIGTGFIGLVLIILSLLLWGGLYSPVIALLVAFIIVFLASIITYLKFIPLRIKEARAASLYKSLLLFSLPLYLNSILFLIMGNLDTLLIGYYLTPEMVGYYNAAFLLMQFIPIFLNSLSFIYMPIVASLVAKGQFDDITALYQNITKWLFVLSFPLFLTFFMFPSNALVLLFGKEYEAASTALMILALGEFVHTFFGLNEHSLIAYAKPRVTLFSSIIATTTNVILNITLIPLYGINGAAISVAVALALVNICNSSYLLFKLKLHPFSKKYSVPVAILIALAVGLYFPLRYLIDYSNWFVLFCYPLFLMLGFFVLIITRSITEDDIRLFRVALTKLRSRKS